MKERQSDRETVGQRETDAFRTARERARERKRKRERARARARKRESAREKDKERERVCAREREPERETDRQTDRERARRDITDCRIEGFAWFTGDSHAPLIVRVCGVCVCVYVCGGGCTCVTGALSSRDSLRRGHRGGCDQAGNRALIFKRQTTEL